MGVWEVTQVLEGTMWRAAWCPHTCALRLSEGVREHTHGGLAAGLVLLLVLLR